MEEGLGTVGVGVGTRVGMELGRVMVMLVDVNRLLYLAVWFVQLRGGGGGGGFAVGVGVGVGLRLCKILITVECTATVLCRK